MTVRNKYVKNVKISRFLLAVIMCAILLPLFSVPAHADEFGFEYTNPETGYVIYIADEEDLLTDSEEVQLIEDMKPIILAVKVYFAPAGLIYLGQKIEYRRLAGSVRTDQTCDLAVKNLKVEVVYRCKTAEINAEFLYVEDRCLPVISFILTHLGHLLSPCVQTDSSIWS